MYAGTHTPQQPAPLIVARRSLPLGSPLHPLAGKLALAQASIGSAEFGAERLVEAIRAHVERLAESDREGELLAFCADAELVLSQYLAEADSLRRVVDRGIELVQLTAANVRDLITDRQVA